MFLLVAVICETNDWCYYNTADVTTMSTNHINDLLQCQTKVDSYRFRLVNDGSLKLAVTSLLEYFVQYLSFLCSSLAHCTRDHTYAQFNIFLIHIP